MRATVTRVTPASPLPPRPPAERLCIFCGLSLTEKTVEHVIPQWLIEMTGPRNRLINLGVDLYRGEPRQFAFGAFKFPACDACNNRYSEFEGKVKPIINLLLNGGKIVGADISRLLDWFDKVRIGLWLGFRYLDKNHWNIRPNFHIDQRIGKYDRALSIYRHPAVTEKGVSFIGVSTPIFGLMPTCFTLRINNMMFINTSSMGLFSEGLGFPYPSREGASKAGDGVLVMLEPGKEEVSLPLYGPPPPEGGLTLVQPMFRVQTLGDTASPYDRAYVRDRSLDFANGVGAIFLGETAEMVTQPVRVADAPISLESLESYTNRMQLKLWHDGSWMNPDMAANPEYRRVVAKAQRKIAGQDKGSRRFRRYRGAGR